VFCGFDLFRSLVGAASGNPRFLTSSFPLALPLGASSSSVHATGDRAKARVGTMVGPPRNQAINHFSPAGAGPSATQVSRHPLMRTLYTLDSCVMKHSVSVASNGTRHLKLNISLTL
jgi:hypothetical protein